ncbi:synaptotagmin-1-like isoform X3 [Dermacentor variabilis]|uniref:synaptotagmin-1-like isoform X3 n=1 Tax=Dermacentor variabilis TaxID=34621 RepID=UPI003F5BE053
MPNGRRLICAVARLPGRTETGRMLELTDEDRLILVASCAGLVTATILVTVCVVTPHCWLYRCIWGREEEKEKRKKLYYGTDVIPLPACPVSTKSVPASGEAKGAEGGGLVGAGGVGGSLVLLPFVRSRAARDSTYSSMSTASSRGEASVYRQQRTGFRACNGCSQSDNSADVAGSVEGQDDAPPMLGKVTILLRFQAASPTVSTTQGFPPGKLFVTIREAQNLPPKPHGVVCDPYISCKVIKGRIKKPRRGSTGLRRPSCIGLGSSGHCLGQYQTQTKRKTQSPLYNETFSLDLARGELKDSSLYLALFDMDKCSNDTEVGEVIVPLKEVDKLVEDPSEHMLELELKEPKQYKGEILFGLSYLPTAERLTFTIMKASNLTSPMNNLESFYPCVRVLLFHSGKLRKKKKTASQHATLCPVYNESLTFDVPQAELDNVVFLVVVSHRDPAQTVSSPDSPTTPVAGAPQQHVGKVVVGACGRGSVLHHWNAMKQSPRKQVTQWHTLR